VSKVVRRAECNISWVGLGVSDGLRIALICGQAGCETDQETQGSSLADH
jgi:hypothetical protein